jgi:hypothetical protein
MREGGNQTMEDIDKGSCRNRRVDAMCHSEIEKT